MRGILKVAVGPVACNSAYAVHNGPGQGVDVCRSVSCLQLDLCESPDTFDKGIDASIEPYDGWICIPEIGTHNGFPRLPVEKIKPNFVISDTSSIPL